MRARAIMAGAGVILAVWAAGCAGPKAGGPESAAALEALQERVEALSADGRTGEALTVLRQGMKNGVLTPHRGQILAWILRTHLQADDVASAQRDYMAEAKRGERSAVEAAGLIEAYLLTEKRHEELAVWCAGLMHQRRLPAEARKVAASFRLEALRAREDVAGILATVSGLVEEFTGVGAAPTVGRLMTTMLGNGEYEMLGGLVAHLDETYPQQIALSRLAAGFRIKSLTRRGLLTEAQEAFLESLDTMTDAAAAELLGEIVEKAVAMKAGETASAFCGELLEHGDLKGRLLQEAESRWVKLGMALQDPALTQERLARIVRRPGSASDRLRIAQDVFYFVMGQGEKKVQQEMVNVCEELRSRIKDAGERMNVNGLLLDGCFVVGDYDRALQIVEKEETGRRKEERDLLIIKLRAHKALQAGQKRQAVLWFKQFMREIENASPGMLTRTDPMTHQSYGHDELLGTNAARIAEIWTSLGETQEARAAIEQARGYYQRALAGVAEKTGDEYRRIEAKLRELPEM